MTDADLALKLTRERAESMKSVLESAHGASANRGTLIKIMDDVAYLVAEVERLREGIHEALAHGLTDKSRDVLRRVVSE